MGKVRIENGLRISEVEFCLESYFQTHFAPLMDKVRDELQKAQAEELKEESNSFAGILRSWALASNPNAIGCDDQLTYMRSTGTGSAVNATDEDYVDMVVDRILETPAYSDDLALLAAEWRTAIVDEIGRERYELMSEQLGADLATAYVEQRFEQMMLDKMVKDRMPKSSAEYILMKGAEGSLLGLNQTVLRSPLNQEIHRRMEEAYNPSKKENLGARVVSFVSDIISFGGVYSWSALGRVACTEAVFTGVEAYVGNKYKEEGALTVEECLSQALWNSDANVFPALRRYTNPDSARRSLYVREVSESLAFPLDRRHVMQPSASENIGGGQTVSAQAVLELPKVPMFIAPDKVGEYLEYAMAHNGQQQTDPLLVGPPRPSYDLSSAGNDDLFEEAHEGEELYDVVIDPNSGYSPGVGDEEDPSEDVATAADTPVLDTLQGQESSGWDGFMQMIGLNGLSDVGKNLPYVISMLPDMLVGLMTGKTQSVSLKGEMLPVASILLGMFVKNPMLKMVLIGTGGANLLNKMGHEALEKEERNTPVQPRYRQYADEPLNPRISNPVIQGNTIVATIDNVPCTITINESAAQAYASGALPLNVLANAVLAKNDQAKALAQANYDNMQISQNQGYQHLR